MIDRREFMTCGAAFGMFPLAGAWAAENDVTWSGFYRIVYDERFALARSIASRAAEHGARLHAISGDITELWFSDLYQRWRTGPASVAGVTLESSAVQLGYFARDQRHVLRYMTRVVPDGTGFGASGPTALLTESMTPVRLLSWTIEPLSADTSSPRSGSFQFRAL